MSRQLSPQRHKELRGRHPLYSRLSGEAIWVFLEDMGLTPEQCDAFMAAFFRQMDQVLAVMDIMDENPHVHAAITCGKYSPEHVCSACRQRCEKVISSEQPEWIQSLPPFGIGCPLSLLQAGTANTLQSSANAPCQRKHEQILCTCFAHNKQEILKYFLERWAIAPASDEIQS